MPVDQYIGGIDMCIFFNFLQGVDQCYKNFNISEPFKNLLRMVSGRIKTKMEVAISHEVEKYNNFLQKR